MSVVKIVHENGYYDCSIADSVKMYILGMFFAREVGRDISFFEEWLLNPNYTCLDGNTVELDKKNEYILLKDTYSQEQIPTILKLSFDQFSKTLEEWKEKVIKPEAKEVIIKYENDQFIFETK